MTNRNTILNELNELGTTLGNLNPQNLYEVPTGYFEGLPTQIINRIKALEAADAKEELEYLSPILSSISKEMPYEVPSGFFRDFNDSLLFAIKSNEQKSNEEIDELSPLLGSLKNKNPYSVPAGYFDTLEAKTEKKEAKVISFTKRRWYRMAIAAAVIGIVVLSGLIILNGTKADIKNPQAWVKKNVINKVSEEKLNEFVTLITPDESQKSVEENEAADKAEIKELMKDVPQKEIEEFLNDAVALESNDEADALMN